MKTKISTLCVAITLIGCSQDDSISSTLPIIDEYRAEVNTHYDQYDERVNGESFLLRHFLKPHYVVIDVGANVGTWSKNALALQPNLKLIAFEPIPEVFARLRKDLGRKAHLHNMAISDNMGKTDFFFYNQSWLATKFSGLYKRDVKCGKRFLDPIKIRVEQDTLDHFCFNTNVKKIDLLKIDAEGAEIKILKGAENMLRDQKIRAIQFEYDTPFEMAGATLKNVLEYLTHFEYVLFKITPKGLIHIDAWEDKYENLSHSNFFAIRSSDLPDFSLMKTLSFYSSTH